MKRSWVRHVSNNGCGINVSPKSNIIMVIMVFSLQRNTDVLIEEDFTVWRDSERCSLVLLGIDLGECLGESC